jgi:hypothetical protein
MLGVLVLWCMFAYAYAFANASPSDFARYLEGARQFLDTGSPYTIPAEPLTYEQMFTVLPFVHPPIALYLFVPFLWLPAVLWWMIPAGIAAWCAYRWRPGEWAWIASLLVLGWPPYVQNIQVGNTDMYVAALTGAGMLYGWPAALLVLKPHSLPWAVFSVGKRSFWIGLGVIAVLAVPFGALWFEWIEMVSKASSVGPSYVTKLLPLVPVIWWLSWRLRLRHGVDAIRPALHLPREARRLPRSSPSEL